MILYFLLEFVRESAQILVIERGRMMKDESFVKRIESVVDYWDEKMPIMTCEECGELIQAIAKVERKLSKDKTVEDYMLESLDKDINNVKTEVADVVIAMAALCIYYHIPFADVKQKIDEKLCRVY